MLNPAVSKWWWRAVCGGAIFLTALFGGRSLANAEVGSAGTTLQASKQVPAMAPTPQPGKAKANPKPLPVKSPKAAKAKLSLQELQRHSWDFQHVKTNEIPKNWKVISGEWGGGPEPEHPGNKIMRQKTVKRNYQMLVSQSSYANFEFSARLRTDSYEHKTSNWQMGLIFRLADKRHYYKYRITAANIALLRCTPKPDSVLPEYLGASPAASATGRRGKPDEQIVLILPFSGRTDTWYTMGVAGYGERLVLKLDGRELRMLQDPAAGHGRVGVFTYKTRAFVDDFHLFYYPTPELSSGVLVTRKSFSPRQDRELLIYYVNPVEGEVQVRVLDAKDKIFQILTQGQHSAGLNSVTWDAQGLLGEFAKPGQYTIQVTAGEKKYKDTVQVK
jgi:hypothetical protein